MNRFSRWNKALTVAGLAVITLALFPAAGFAQPLKKFTNKQFRYALSYPPSWYFHDGGKQVDILSTEDSFEAESGAGLAVVVEAVEAEDEGLVEKTAERIAGEINERVEITDRSTRMIGGSEWYGLAFADRDEGAEGELYVLVRGVAVYAIGTFYKGPGSRDAFRPAIEGVVESFSFMKIAYREYKDKRRGLAFRHPDHLTVENEGDEVRLMLAGRGPGSSDPFAYISLGVFDADDKDLQGLDEEGLFEYLKKNVPESEYISAPAPVTLSKNTWIRGELMMNEGRTTIYLRKTGTFFFGIVYIVQPAGAEEEYREMWETFIKSLTLDTTQWLKGLQEKRAPQNKD